MMKSLKGKYLFFLFFLSFIIISIFKNSFENSVKKNFLWTKMNELNESFQNNINYNGTLSFFSLLKHLVFSLTRFFFLPNFLLNETLMQVCGGGCEKWYQIRFWWWWVLMNQRYMQKALSWQNFDFLFVRSLHFVMCFCG